MLKTGAIFLCCFCLLAAWLPVSEGTHAYGGMQAFANVTLGPYRRKTEQAPVWLSSGPRSRLSKPIIIIHSRDQYLTASWQGVLVQHTPLSLIVFTSKKKKKPQSRKNEEKTKICVINGKVCISTHFSSADRTFAAVHSLWDWVFLRLQIPTIWIQRCLSAMTPRGWNI